MIRKDFTWNQFAFNSFESTFNWCSFSTSKKSIDEKGYQLKSIYFQFNWIYFQLSFLLNKKWPKQNVHNRVPSKQLHYWGSGSLMGYPLEFYFGCCFFNKGLIRHLIIWETLHFQGFNMDMAFWSKWTSFTQRKVDTVRGLCFFTQKVFVNNRVPSKNYIIEDLGQLWGTPVKKCLGAVFFF